MFGFRAKIAAAVALCGVALGGCATTPPTPDMIANNDPYEPTNRDIFAFNMMWDRTFLVPTVTRYRDYVPAGGRQAFHNFLVNLTLPSTFVGDVLQGEMKRGSQTAGRFLINTTMGLGGFFDPATTHFEIPGHGEDYGQTFAVWGATEGPFLMLPLFGPSNPRDASGLVAGTALDPTNFIRFKQHIYWMMARQYFSLLDLRSQTFDALQGIQRSSVDYYASLRGLYRQLRNNEIRNGRQERAELPDF
jgi:phospholipid-binding lipoprotein MlaA